MGEVYLSPVSRWIELGLAVTGVLILYFAARAFLSAHAWGDGAEYEMLGLKKPSQGEEATSQGPGGNGRRKAAIAGVIGTEDKVVRFGFSIALSYLAVTWFGIGSLAMWIMVFPAAYFLVTSIIGLDPLYRKLGLTTRVD